MKIPRHNSAMYQIIKREMKDIGLTSVTFVFREGLRVTSNMLNFYVLLQLHVHGVPNIIYRDLFSFSFSCMLAM